MRTPVDRSLEAWERREQPLLAGLPYVMLVFSAVLTVFVRHAARESPVIDLALCGLAAVWMLCLHTLVPAGRQRPAVTAVFFPGLIAIMTALVIRDPWFGFFTFTGYFYLNRIPWGWWRLLGTAAVAGLTGTSQAGGFATAAHGPVGLVLYIGCVLVNVVIGGAVNWFGWVGEALQGRRNRMMAELSEANRRLEATLAENAGLHEQLITQAREAGVLDERQRMAREIHDTLAQGLMGIIMQLQAAEQTADDPAERRRHFDAATSLARESLTEARRSVDALRPESLEQGRLADALASVAERWSALHRVPVQVTMTGMARPLPADTEFALLRTAQEALANVAKHARASRVGLTLSYMEHEVALDVRDDGRGFAPASAGVCAGLPVGAPTGRELARVGGGPEEPGRDGAGPYDAGPHDAGPHDAGPELTGGFGLLAMRQRIEGLSGTLQVESEPGAGTAISACVPVVPGRAAERA